VVPSMGPAHHNASALHVAGRSGRAADEPGPLEVVASCYGDRVVPSSVKTRVLVAILCVAGAFGLQAQTPGPPFSCVLVQELTGEKLLTPDNAMCDTRLSPASTFKIPHALVALETGVVTTDSVERWDGTKYERQAKWNQDHTVISALRPSVLWVFQRIAPRIGAQRMSEWLTRLDYGNRSTSGSVSEYWINGTLQISPREQLSFVRRFYRDELPISVVHVAAVREGLEQRPRGTVENSLGVHRLDGDWREASLNAKTGATTAAGHRVSWLVGELRVRERRFAFASAVWRSDGDVDALDAARLAARTFTELGLLSAKSRAGK
jgi:beta-lactamase class D